MTKPSKGLHVQTVRVIANGQACVCCVERIVTGEAQCLDPSHDETDHPMTGGLAADAMAPWLVVDGCDCPPEAVGACDGHVEVFYGRCDVCGADHAGTFAGQRVSVVK